MPLSRGAQLGPYELLAPIGAGGMGEVWKARDTRLGRTVAIKTSAERFTNRFAGEARAIASLNHPNICQLYDIGPNYLVMELVDGEQLKGPLPVNKAVAYAGQILDALDAAHRKGITHRDLKPANILVTKLGIKLLDFGLAKQSAPLEESDATRMALTLEGQMLGTLQYMSPEQLQGKEADARSDLFAFGCVLYEMLTGRRAFEGASTTGVVAAILGREPAPLAVAPPLERVIRKCLAKDPDERFQTARDLKYNLLLAMEHQPTKAAASWPMLPWFVAASLAANPARMPHGGALLIGLIMVIVPLAFWVGKHTSERTKVSPAVFRQLTFRRGMVSSARFAPDGHTIVYGAAWDGQPFELFSTRLDSPESRSLGLPHADLLSMAPGGEMAISLDRSPYIGGMTRGTLARVPLTGGAERELHKDVHDAAWSPDGSQLALVRDVGGRHRLEFPVGNVLYQTGGWIGHPRFSPKGDLIAFLDHPIRGDDNGLVAIVDLTGRKRELTPRYASTQGLAWSPSGDEIWYTAGEAGINLELRSVRAQGGPQARVVARIPGRLVLQDIFRDGSILVTGEYVRNTVAALTAGSTKERDLSWLDYSFGVDLSADGKTLLICEQGGGAGARYTVYTRRTDGSPAVKIGEGQALALSPDGEWALSLLLTSLPQQLVLLPTGTGEPRLLPRDMIESYQMASWFTDGKRILIAANERGRRERLYIQDVSGGMPRAITAEGVTLPGNHAISPDGRFVVATDADQRAWLYRIDGGDPRPIPGLSPGELQIQWSTDGRSVYAFKSGTAKVYRVVVSTGQRELWKEITPFDPAGSFGIFLVQLTPDAKSYVYSCNRHLSDLYLVSGWR